MNVETLFCTCGRPVRVVRLNAETLTLGHTVNPKNQRHPVTLSRSADDASSIGLRRSRPLNEVRGDALTASPRTTTKGKRASSNGIGSDRTSRVPRRPSETSAAT